MHIVQKQQLKERRIKGSFVRIVSSRNSVLTQLRLCEIHYLFLEMYSDIFRKFSYTMYTKKIELVSSFKCSNVQYNKTIHTNLVRFVTFKPHVAHKMFLNTLQNRIGVTALINNPVLEFFYNKTFVQIQNNFLKHSWLLQ